MDETVNMMDKKDFLVNRYLEVSERERAWGLYAISSGLAVSGTSKECPHLFKGVHVSPKGREYDCFNIVFVERGSMLYYSVVEEPGLQLVDAGSVILIPPNARHRYHANPDTGVREYWIKFDGYHARALVAKGVLPSTTAIFAKGEHSANLNSFESVQFLAEDEGDWAGQRKILPFLTNILSSLTPNLHASVPPIVEQARAYMTRNSGENLDFADFAKKHGMTPRNFRRVFKHALGQSPLQYFLSIKVNKAKALLESGRYSVKEVAFRLGFEDQYYFSRVFKKRTDVCPNKWAR